MGELVTLAELIKHLDALRHHGKRIVFTNGCFDILHAGHSRYLAAARAEGDVLVVGLNSDRSVRQIKGPRRPIIAQHQRAEVLASLACVDYVVLFDESDPRQLIQSIEPDVLVKGADWAEANIVGAEFVKARGGRVRRIELLPGISTSIIIERICDHFSREPASDDEP